MPENEAIVNSIPAPRQTTKPDPRGKTATGNQAPYTIDYTA